MWLRWDKRFIYALLASFFLHSIILLLWPRIRLPDDFAKPATLVRVNLIEEHSESDIKTDQIEHKSPAADMEKKISDNALIINEGGEIIKDIIKNLPSREPEEVIVNVPAATFSKESIQPEEEEYVKVWPEELTGGARIDTGKLPAPKGAKGSKEISIPADFTGGNAPLFHEEFPEERAESYQQPQQEITWEGKPRKWIKKPDTSPTYSGDEEGLVKLRFWVDERGEVINAIPVQKLSPELEDMAMNYIFSWRFESLPGAEPQEGIIRINFKLERPGR